MTKNPIPINCGIVCGKLVKIPKASPKTTRTMVASNVVRLSRRYPTKGIPTIPPRGRRTVKARYGNEHCEQEIARALTFRQSVGQFRIPSVEFELTLYCLQVPVDADPRAPDQQRLKM